MARKHKHGKHNNRVVQQQKIDQSINGLAVLYDWYQSRIAEYKTIALAWLEYQGSTPEHRFRMYLEASAKVQLYDFKAGRLIESL